MSGSQDESRPRATEIARLGEYLDLERIELDSAASSASEALEELSRLLGGNDGSVREAILDDLVAREQLASTGVGGGIAFPHARTDALSSIRLALLRTRSPLEFSALDGKPVDLFVGVAGPPGRREYLTVLSRLAYLFRSAAVRRQLRSAEGPAEIRGLFERLGPEGAVSDGDPARGSSGS